MKISNIFMLDIQALAFKRQAHFLFQNLDFQIDSGELLQVTGANGSGKTTLLRILAGLLKPSSGDIRYVNRSIYCSKSQYQTRLAYLGHTHAIKPGLTVRENLISHAVLMGAIPEVFEASKLDKLLEEFSLLSLSETLAYQLSQGQQRRLALAKIILSQKPIWILDEPLAALDHAGVCQFNDMLKKHLAADGIAVVATHQALDSDFRLAKKLTL
jgi:heme exporter protein A